MADSKLIIEIETLLKEQGAEKTLAILSEVKKKMADQADSSKPAADGIDKVNKNLERTGAIARIASMALNGTSEGMRSAGMATMSFFNALGKFSVIGSAIFLLGQLAAITKQLHDKFAGAKTAVKDLETSTKEASDSWEKTFQRFSQQSFDNLTKEISKIRDSYNDAISSADRLYRINVMLSKSEEEREIADLNLRAAKTGMSKEGRDQEEQSIRYRYEQKRFDDEGQNLSSKKDSEIKMNATASYKLRQLLGISQTESSNYEEKTRIAEQNGLSQFLTPAEIKNQLFTDQSVMDRLKKQEADFEKEAVSFNRVTGDAELDKEFKTKADAAFSNLRKLRQLISDLPELNTAAKRKSQALDEFNKESPALEKSIKESSGSIEELDAQIATLSERNETSKTKRAGVITQRNADYNKAEDEKDPKKVRNQAQQTLVDAIYVKDDTPLDNAGQPLSATAQTALDEQRRVQAVGVLQKAQDLVVAGDDPEAVYAKLTQVLNRLGVTLDRTHKEKADIIAALDKLDGKVGKLETNVSNLNSQQSASPAFE